jgi:antitoxin component of RelBE/YafQ-DinJ toxin-antitoxin module
MKDEVADMAKNRQLKISVEPELADSFKLVCAADGISMSGGITGFMERCVGEKHVRIHQARLTARRHRRKAVRDVIALLNAAAQAEETYRDNIPDNLQGGEAYESADVAVAAIEEAAAILEGAFE